ncbi:MAG: histidine-type phosphatase [Edaphobacter sp.]|uniref:histidine-type phosphatase n=1 Tax=Edaphobacter sp. TaxID=1934404 RepID=UPI002395DBBA|nr:histidine-type phosphatase [Edaphobacter sp.]MDE1175864.1 histidine-type phosphatase [Edaphobacter sp.]
MLRRSLMLLLLAACAAGDVRAQGAAPAAKEELRGVVIVARHGLRAPIESEMRSGVFNAQPWPKWPVQAGLLTPHGIDALKQMGEYYRQQYGGLITNCHSVLAYSTKSPRAFASAVVVIGELFHEMPQCDAHSIEMSLTTDPPDLDKGKLGDAVNGRMGDDPLWFTGTYARPLETMHDVLTQCAGCRTVPDFRTMMIEGEVPAMMHGEAARDAAVKVVARDARRENAVAPGADFAENFLLQYIEGMPMKDVGWGRVDRAKLDELMEMNTRYHDFMLRTPYWSKAAAGPLALKIAQLLQVQAKGDGSAKVAYLSAHDANLGWLGGLLQMDWKVSDETQNATPPGSAMVFELWHGAKGDVVRVRFVAQTLDQIRSLAVLTEGDGPSVSPVYVPGCSEGAPGYGCSVEGFVKVVQKRVGDL